MLIKECGVMFIEELVASFDPQYLLSIILKIVLAVLFGGIIGLEREMKRRAAGLRTHMLVCIGAAMTVMTNEFIVSVTGSGDPTRMAAQVVSGIGFLGAGTIIVTGSTHIRGLTTAAGMWAAAAVGLAIGAGYYSAAIIATLVITLVLTILQKADKFFSRRSTFCDLYIELAPGRVMRDFLDELKRNGIVVISFDKQQSVPVTVGQNGFIVTLHSHGLKSEVFCEHVSRLDTVDFASEIGVQ